MAETVGSLVDKLSIIQLRIFHMREQVERTDVTPDFREQCRRKLEVMAIQKSDLEQELTELSADVLAGRKKLKVYYQFKMYNDPKYRSHSK